ncbi:laminin subunit alpha-4 isoform X1 [Clarias gariepinus]|uniref:laminin subunit alpha-4 isoform X1 n=1 Tax=Clarias gariepinus TaxID=13013 RepID=UPI00234C584A|nr:laminin subunit alpha-4 isoform X1 [Clarias gariepinus]
MDRGRDMSSVVPLLVFFCMFSMLFAQQDPIYTVCARGFFLSEQDICLPCNCKGHALDCEDITGICIGCQNHSTGDFCERCQDGYVLHVSPDGQHECRPCACPVATETNNFATHCEVRGVALRCVCQVGYAGHYCERCAPGYYGNPIRAGDSCKKCDCNGNSDPNLIFNECHNVTGRCLHCYHNTAGDNCERCAPGYYGDAISAKDCHKCECNQCGTASCDDRTGVCHCKPGVTGQLCDRCEDNHSGFSSCMGCRRCVCEAAALQTTCNKLTQSCQCRPGAGGRYCEHCLPGYWDYTHTGCKKCDCREGNCDAHTGECLPEMSQVSECSVDCDECIWHLIGDVRQSNKTVDQLRNSVLNISTGAAAYDRLKYYNYTSHTLRVQFVGWRNKSAVMRKHTGELEEETVHLQTDTELLTHQEEGVLSLGQQVDSDSLHSFTLAEMLAANLTSLNVLVEEMISDWVEYSVQHDVDPEQQKQKESEAEHKLRHMRTLTLSPKHTLATQENAHTQQLLQQVRQMEKSVTQMETRLPPVSEPMKRFSTSLTHGQIHLHRAHDTLQQIHSTHTRNLLHLQRREAHKQRLLENYNAVNQTVMSANDVLEEATKGVADLGTMVTSVREHHAEVDGAAVEIQRKTDQLSKADESLVQRATEHAHELQRHAHELQQNLKRSDTHGFVQKALEASNVYDNIVKYINEADVIGGSALNMSNRTEDALDGLAPQLNIVKRQSSDMFKETETLRSEYEEVETSVTDTKKYIEETRDMLQTSRSNLKELVNSMKTLQRVQKLQSTQEAAQHALNHSAEVLGVITPIKEKVEEWDRNMRNNQYSTSAYQQAVDSARNTVEGLSEIVPRLLTKLQVVEEKKPANVSTNIMRVRELIAQARSIASKVQVSMKFNGESSVELHPPADVDELKAVTSINLYVRVDPDLDGIEERFLLYIGSKNGNKDYMGVAIKNDNLVFVYNLGGEDVEIPLSSKPVSSWPPVFNHVRVERLGRHGKVYLTVPSQGNVAEQKFIQKGEWDGTESLFHLDPRDTVFIIGGAPADIKLPPALSLAPFIGCIELASLNNEVISLYNFKKLHNMNVAVSAPCPRYKLAFSQGRVASYLFDGSGYALVRNIERRARVSVVTRFDIEVRTVAQNGVLLLMVNEDHFFVLEMKNGFLRLVYDFGFANGPIVLEGNLAKLQINDARYHEVSVIYHQSKKVILLVDRSFVKSTDNEKKTLPFNDIYIGGAPSDLLKSRSEFSPLIGLKGCVKGFQFQKKDFNLLEEPGTIGISSGCPEESFMSRKAYFAGDGYLSSIASISPFSSFEGGMSFRTTEPSGLLFYHRDGTEEFSLSLENGAVVLHSRGTKVKSRKHYSDGRPHFLVASITKQKYQLVVDDKDKQDKKNSGSAPHTEGVKEFYYGGSPQSNILNFTGCISYAYISRQDRDIEAEDFQRYTENVGVSLQDCPVERPPTTLRHTRSVRHTLHKTHPAPNTPAALHQVSRTEPALLLNVLEGQDDPQTTAEREATPCYLSPRPPAVRNSHYFSGDSWLAYDGIAEVIRERSEFSVSLRTHSAQGMVACVCGEGDEDFMALFLSKGKLVFTFGSAQHTLQLHTKHTHNDGRWHDVVFRRDGNRGLLLVDGLTLMEDEVQIEDFYLNLQGALYVGGLPAGHANKHMKVKSGFSGCVRDLRLNGHFLSSVPRSFGVTPCLEGKTEAGMFFFKEGGYTVLDHSLSVGGQLEVVMELRPRVTSALLLHFYIAPEENLSVYLQHGQVFVQLNNETGGVYVSPQHSVCDGNWHRVKVVRDSSGLKLDVDGKQRRVIRVRFPKQKHRVLVPVFIGGAPDDTLPVSMRMRSSYVGCVRNLSINQHSVNFKHASLVNGVVSVDGCPAA